MRQFSMLTLSIAWLAAAGCATPAAQTRSSDQGAGAAAGETRSDRVPIIDRALFFGDPKISAATLSPDGRWVAFIKPYREVRNIWVKPIDAPFDSARPVTADERPVPGYFWSRDSEYLLYVQDKGGNENFHVYAVDPKADPAQATGVPPASDLTPIDGVRAYIYSVPKKDPGHIIVGLNDRDASYHDVYRVAIDSGERKLLIENTDEVASWVFDLDGDVRLAVRMTDDGGTDILRVEDDGLERIYHCTFEESCHPYRFHPDDERVYLISNKGPEADLTRLLLLAPASGETELVESDPEGEVDFGGAVFSAKTDELIATTYRGDRLRIYPKDEKLARDLAALREQLPAGELSLQSMTRDMEHFLVSVASDVDPGSVYRYDRSSREAELLYRSRPELPSEHLAPMKPVRYQARDGLTIPAYLTLPRGVDAKKLPTVVFPHGGPWARDTWGYDAYAQFLANRGYAVLQPNFRGSTGYGQKFLNAGNRQWGTGSMQHDITDGVKWLIAEDIADPERVAIFGGSYGGYATLAGVTFTPDLYACGIPYVAPSNILTLLASIPPYWKPIVEMFHKRVGDPSIPAERADLQARSPLNFVERIRVPLLVIHGANDPRVKQAEADQIVVALREKGHAVQYLVAPDEGHGFRAPDNRMAVAVAMERFLAEHLGGRLQQAVDEAIAAKLAAITVDPKTVELPDDEALAKQRQQAAAAGLPAVDAGTIEPVLLRYRIVMELGVRQMKVEARRRIERVAAEGGERIRITAEVDTPQGEQTDVFELDAASLRPIERRVSGSAEMELRYSRDAIRGRMQMRGRKVEIDQALEAPVVADGSGLELTLAALPLEAGYQTTLRIFEPATQRVRPMKLTVAGQDRVETPAGAFDTWKLTLSPLDDDKGGATMQVRAAPPHYVIRAAYQMSAKLGGFTMRTTLTGLDAAGE